MTRLCVCHHKCSTIKIYYYKNASSTTVLNFLHFSASFSSYSTQRSNCVVMLNTRSPFHYHYLTLSLKLQPTDLLCLHLPFHLWIAGMESKSKISGLCNCIAMRFVTVASAGSFIATTYYTAQKCYCKAIVHAFKVRKELCVRHKHTVEQKRLLAHLWTKVLKVTQLNKSTQSHTIEQKRLLAHRWTRAWALHLVHVTFLR